MVVATEVRLIRPGEEGAWARSVLVPFLDAGASDAEERWRPHLEADRTWIAIDQGTAVGNCCLLSYDLSLPAAPDEVCGVLPFAAVSAVGVHPTHRRRGILRTMMSAMLLDAMERGEAMAGLQASESSIYGRFGFGTATMAASYVIDNLSSAFAVPVEQGPLTLLDAAQASKVLPEQFERARRTRPGQVSRNDAIWADVWADRPVQRKGASGNFYVSTDDGFAIYRARETDQGGLQYAEIEVCTLLATTAEAEARLWRYLLDLDLVRRVVAARRPLDEVLRYRLCDPRQLRTTSVSDFLWLRILDVAKALEARGYRCEGSLVLEVVGAPGQAELAEGCNDPALGRWRLEASSAGATARRAGGGDEPDIRLGVSELGSVYLGGVAPSLLARAGRIEELRPRGLDRADSVLATRPAPFSDTGF